MLELSDDEFKAGIIKMFQKQLQTQVKKKISAKKQKQRYLSWIREGFIANALSGDEEGVESMG